MAQPTSPVRQEATDALLVDALCEQLGVDRDLLTMIAAGDVLQVGMYGRLPCGDGWHDLPRTAAEWRSWCEGHVVGARRLEDCPPCVRNREWIRTTYPGTPRVARTRTPKPAPLARRGDCVVYRLLGTDGRLLYIGSTRSFPARLAAHRKRWGDVIVDVRVELHEDAGAMLAAEARAIAAEQPPLNISGT